MPRSNPQEQPRSRRDLRLRPQSADEIENAAQITSTDVLRAQILWQRSAPHPYTSLLDALEVPDAATL